MDNTALLEVLADERSDWLIREIELNEQIFGLKEEIKEMEKEATADAEEQVCLYSIIRELLEWEKTMGGWAAPCWERAREAVKNE